MKATHKLTYLPDGDEYLFSVVGDSFYWSTEELSGWVGPASMFAENYVETQTGQLKRLIHSKEINNGGLLERMR